VNQSADDLGSPGVRHSDRWYDNAAKAKNSAATSNGTTVFKPALPAKRVRSDGKAGREPEAGGVNACEPRMAQDNLRGAAQALLSSQ